MIGVVDRYLVDRQIGLDAGEYSRCKDVSEVNICMHE